MTGEVADGAFPLRGGWWLILIFDYSAKTQVVIDVKIVILQFTKLGDRDRKNFTQTRQYFIVTLFGTVEESFGGRTGLGVQD